MNHHVTARTFASAALHEIQEHGIGRGSWLKQTITNARIEVMRVSDQDWSMVANHLQNDYITLMLFDAQKAISNRDPREAVKCLEKAIESLDMLLKPDASEVVDRLLKSVFPKSPWDGMGERR